MADISVIVCTHNRAGSLTRMLKSCCALQVPAKLDWELLVVANACNDDTPRVVEDFQSRLPLRMVELTGVPVLSRARNEGARAARGNLVVYTDDDVEVDPRWLAAYAEGLCNYPEAVFFGGQIIPKYDGGRPSWLTDELEYGTLCGVCVSRRMGERPRPYSPPHEFPFGANFSVRRANLIERQFRTDLGPIGRRRLCHEEADLLRALMSKGYVGVYLPDAVVWHHTDAARLKLSFIVRSGYGCGRSDVISGAIEKPEASQWTYWLPNWHMRGLCRETMRFLGAGCVRGRGVLYGNAWCVARGWGRVHEWVLMG
jgi:glycosyltransferase involved in cell wall biosynthesis